jgi:hypothetical protein
MLLMLICLAYNSLDSIRVGLIIMVFPDVHHVPHLLYLLVSPYMLPLASCHLTFPPTAFPCLFTPPLAASPLTFPPIIFCKLFMKFVL